MTDSKPQPFKYPYKRLREAAKPTRDDAATLDLRDIKSGAGKPPTRIPAKFEAKAKSAAVNDTTAATATAQRMLYAYAEREASSATVLDAAVERAQRAPSRSNLENMRAVANEVGRRRGGGSTVRKKLTQDLVDEISGDEG